jgi:hypothetical protein
VCKSNPFFHSAKKRRKIFVDGFVIKSVEKFW